MITFEMPQSFVGRVVYTAILRRIMWLANRVDPYSPNKAIEEYGDELLFSYDSFVDVGYFSSSDEVKKGIQEAVDQEVVMLKAHIKNNRTGKRHKHGSGVVHLFRGYDFYENAFSIKICKLFNWDLLIEIASYHINEMLNAGGRFIIKDDEGMEIFNEEERQKRLGIEEETINETL